MTRRAALLAVALLAGCGGGDSEEPATESSGGLYEVSVSPDPASSPVNRVHTWTLELRDADGAAVTGASIQVEGDSIVHGRVRESLRGGLGVNPELEVLPVGTLPRAEQTKAKRVLDRRRHP